jgi:Trk K+ transport system NAD-binding subunit
LGVIEIEVKENLIGKTIQDINIPGDFIVVALRRMQGVIIPEPKTALRNKDVLMGVVKVASLREVRERFHLGER